MSAVINSPELTLSLADEVYELTLHHEPCNEIGSAMLASLEGVLGALDVTKARALIVSSDRRRGFCAGADLRELYRGIIDRPEEEHLPSLRAFLDRIHAVMNRLDMLPLTTIGVIHGVCFGGGFELALTCDVLICEKSARFCFPELRLGIIPGFGGIPRLKREIGNAPIRDLLLTGRSFNAKKALQLGLASQMVGVGEGLTTARRLGAQATRYDRDAAVTAKAFIKTLPQAELEEEKEHFVRLFQNPHVREALRRFVESEDLRPYLA